MEPQPIKPKGVVMNWGVITNIIGGVIAAVLAILPTMVESLPPTAYAMLALIFAAANGGFLAFKQAQVNTLYDENRELRRVEPRIDLSETK